VSHDVGAVSDFAERELTIAQVGGRAVGIVRWDGAVYAISNVCTHQRGPLCHGTLSARLTAATPGTMDVDDDTPVIACPWHGWEFDVRSGRALWDERYAVRTYAVSVASGRVLVDLERQAS
jgi:nitrite reductase (NADH) small subunit